MSRTAYGLFIWCFLEFHKKKELFNPSESVDLFTCIHLLMCPVTFSAGNTVTSVGAETECLLVY